MSEQQKLSGPEMMIRSVMRVMGVDPKALTEMMTTVIGEMQTGLRMTVETMQRLELKQDENRRLLLHIIHELKIPMPDASHMNGHAVGSVEILPPEQSKGN